jgi:hypothetical protein
MEYLQANRHTILSRYSNNKRIKRDLLFIKIKIFNFFLKKKENGLFNKIKIFSKKENQRKKHTSLGSPEEKRKLAPNKWSWPRSKTN